MFTEAGWQTGLQGAPMVPREAKRPPYGNEHANGKRRACMMRDLRTEEDI